MSRRPSRRLDPVGLAVSAARRLPAPLRAIRDRHTASWIAGKIRPLPPAIDAQAPRRVNILHPAIDPTHFFGGFIAVFNLARRLVEGGQHVRIIALEQSRPPHGWQKRLEGYEGLDAKALAGLDVVFAGSHRGEIAFSPRDALLATHWTAAHVAHDAAGWIDAERFAYLIQEYEPFTFPLGSAAALSRQSYDLPHSAIFSTELLRDYFAQNRVGVFSGGAEAGRRNSVTFRNAITPVGPVTAESLRNGGPRRLLFYARPERHAERNMFELGSMALDEAISAGRFEDWELIGVGTVGRSRQLTLPRSGARLRLVPRGPQAEYARLLSDGCVGLALMHTPHPSLPPIEMAAAGMPTVTSVFGNKDAAALEAISPNLIAAQPTVEGVAAALARAEEAAADPSARAEGSTLDWPRDWDTALDDATIGAIGRLLER